MVTKFPRILEFHVDRTLRPRLDFLTRRCGIPQDELAKVGGGARSRFFLLSFAIRSLFVRQSHVHSQAGPPRPRPAAAPGVQQVVVKAPMVLELSVEDTLQPRATFLSQHLGLGEGDLGKLVARHPQVRGAGGGERVGEQRWDRHRLALSH